VFIQIELSYFQLIINLSIANISKRSAHSASRVSKLHEYYGLEEICTGRTSDVCKPSCGHHWNIIYALKYVARWRKNHDSCTGSVLQTRNPFLHLHNRIT